MTKEYIAIEVHYLEKKGRRWFHKHKWVPLADHPQGGDVSFCWMLEQEERDRVEMCLACPARRVLPLVKDTNA